MMVFLTPMTFEELVLSLALGQKRENETERADVVGRHATRLSVTMTTISETSILMVGSYAHSSKAFDWKSQR